MICKNINNKHNDVLIEDLILNGHLVLCANTSTLSSSLQNNRRRKTAFGKILYSLLALPIIQTYNRKDEETRKYDIEWIPEILAFLRYSQRHQEVADTC